MGSPPWAPSLSPELRPCPLRRLPSPRLARPGTRTECCAPASLQRGCTVRGVSERPHHVPERAPCGAAGDERATVEEIEGPNDPALAETPRARPFAAKKSRFVLHDRLRRGHSRGTFASLAFLERHEGIWRPELRNLDETEHRVAAPAAGRAGEPAPSAVDTKAGATDPRPTRSRHERTMRRPRRSSWRKSPCPRDSLPTDPSPGASDSSGPTTRHLT